MNHDSQIVQDVLIVGDKISAVGTNLVAPEGARVFDAAGRFVIPGGIDVRVCRSVVARVSREFAFRLRENH